MGEIDEFEMLGSRGKVPRPSRRRRTDRGTARWTALLIVAGALGAAVPAVALLQG
ncbi:MAG TPA: hypothetical protein VHV57_13035 [Acidimicrobiales bacterium]|jgi:hypothetical protein|nr:hypothetical protein [Acidimicrobiales bacterium]